MKKIVGTVITLVIGGTAYSVSQADIARNFSKDTGLTQQESEQYIESVSEDDLVPYDEIGSDYISEGQDTLSLVSEIDCADYYYEWETDALSCEEGKSQLERIGNSEIALGKGYTQLADESASSEDISSVVALISKLNANYSLEIAIQLFDNQAIDEMKTTNSFNKAMLQAALDSE